MRPINQLFCLAIFVALSSSGIAQQRTWVDSTGKSKVEASLVTVKNEKAYLEKKDGSVAQVPLDRLSTADLEFLNETSEYRPFVKAILERRWEAAGITKKIRYAKFTTDDPKSAVVRVFKSGDQSFSMAAFSPDGGRLAVFAGLKLMILDIEGKQVLSSHSLPRSAILVKKVVFSPDGKAVFASYFGGNIHRWDVDDNGVLSPVGSSKLCERDIIAIHISADSQHGIALSEDGIVTHWQTSDLKPEFSHAGFDGHSGSVFITKHGGQALATNSHVLALYDLKSKQVMQSLSLAEYNSGKTAFSPDGTVLAYSHSSTISFIEVKTGKRLPDLKLNGSFESFAFSGDGSIFILWTHDVVEQWEVEKMKKIGRIAAKNNQFQQTAISPDGVHLASFPDYGKTLNVIRFTSPD